MLSPLAQGGDEQCVKIYSRAQQRKESFRKDAQRKQASPEQLGERSGGWVQEFGEYVSREF